MGVGGESEGEQTPEVGICGERIPLTSLELELSLLFLPLESLAKKMQEMRGGGSCFWKLTIHAGCE